METAYLEYLNAERLKPGEKPVQGRLIAERAMQDRFDRLYRGSEPLEVDQGLGRENPDHADLVVGRRQSTPSRSRWTEPNSTILLPGIQRAMHSG
jgi:hypothetical protein